MLEISFLKDEQMQNTIGIYNDRKAEIEFYYSVMANIDTNNGLLEITTDNRRFFKIMKSNFLLMLYNLVEATITNGMLEIYDELKSDQCSYNDVISEIQELWSNYKISAVYGVGTACSVYENRVKDIITEITLNTPIVLTKEALGIKGNLDARKIKDICDKHKIRYELQSQGEKLYEVKMKRQELAHGDVSFGDCARDFTLDDLAKIEEEVFIFLNDILNGMKKYYNDKLYKKNIL